jgi:hypothetical protein
MTSHTEKQGASTFRINIKFDPDSIDANSFFHIRIVPLMKDYHNEESLDSKESLERLIYDCIHSFRKETAMRQNHIDYVVDHFIFANFNNKDYWFN